MAAMFSSLTERLSRAAQSLRGRGRLTEDNIAETLAEVHAHERYHCSLVTGNIQPVARLKLGAAGILYPFAEGQGGFGSDSDDRNDLPSIARMSAGQLWNGGDAWPA